MRLITVDSFVLPPGYSSRLNYADGKFFTSIYDNGESGDEIRYLLGVFEPNTQEPLILIQTIIVDASSVQYIDGKDTLIVLASQGVCKYDNGQFYIVSEYPDQTDSWKQVLWDNTRQEFVISNGNLVRTKDEILLESDEESNHSDVLVV